MTHLYTDGDRWDSLESLALGIFLGVIFTASPALSVGGVYFCKQAAGMRAEIQTAALGSGEEIGQPGGFEHLVDTLLEMGAAESVGAAPVHEVFACG